MIRTIIEPSGRHEDLILGQMSVSHISVRSITQIQMADGFDSRKVADQNCYLIVRTRVNLAKSVTVNRFRRIGLPQDGFHIVSGKGFMNGIIT